MAKLTMTLKCISDATHFEGLVDAPVLCSVHRPMQHVQGYFKSHWMLPSGNYSIWIAPAAAGATANITTMAKCTSFLLAILMALAVRRYNMTRIAWWRRSRALVEATGCRHWASIAADSGAYPKLFLCLWYTNTYSGFVFVLLFFSNPKLILRADTNLTRNWKKVTSDTEHGYNKRT